MAATAKAKAGTAKGTKTNPKPPPKKKARNPRKKKFTAASAQTHANILAEVKQAHPGISSSDFALVYKITPEEVFRMRYFVHEYLRDFNVKNAALRMGYNEATAYDTGYIFLNHSFTQLRLQEVMDEMDAEKIVSSSQIVSALWKESNKSDTVRDGCSMSNSSTRISALSQLAKIKGLTAPKGVTPTETPHGGVMLVPFYVAPDDWENSAKQSQHALKKSVCIDAEVIS